ncbi:MAG: SCP2 sterol-binding domain-containing protein [Solirubrobacteraceae bacterium]
MADSSPLTDPAQYAALVRNTTDDQLAAGLRANRDVILGQIFTRMAEHLDPDKARDAEAVIEWRICGRDGGGHDRYQVIVTHGTCAIEREGGHEPSAVFTIGPVEFLRLVTGNVNGPELFLTGRITVEGDLMLAAIAQSWFRVPGQRTSAGA